MYLMGIDVGSTGCKATIVDAYGNVVGSSYREYATVITKEGYGEIPVESIRNEVKNAIRFAAEGIQKGGIKAICTSSFGEGFVAVDEKGEPLNNPILYIDPRGKEYLDRFSRDSLGFDMYKTAGTSPQSIYSLPKLMWIKDHRPDLYNKIRKILFVGDYILYMLGAEPFCTYSLAARSMAFDVINKKWSDEIIECAGLDRSFFPQPVKSGTVLGKICPKVAAELGLSDDILLVAGGHDQPCVALGAGVNKAGLAVDGLGTVECITPAFDSPIITPGMVKNNFVLVPHVLDNLYVTYAFTLTSGSVVRWYRDTFGQQEKEYAESIGINAYDYIMDIAYPEPSGMFVLPHFSGSATPYMDSESKGAILGVTLDTTKDKFVKALLEGITYEIMVNAEILNQEGIKTDHLRAVGGLAKSDSYLHLKASMMNSIIETLNVTEAGTAGVAILAGVACGIYDSIEDGIDKVVKVKKVYYPDPKVSEYYQEQFVKYKRIYRAMKEIYK
ncbi:MAG: xylulose kinase [Clostridiaceae bacterium]|nr:xylulose kinase [Clostridiaceae bacterium]